MRSRTHLYALILVVLTSIPGFVPAFATVFANLHGVIHDQQHFPIANATITLHAADSAFELHASTDARGEFDIPKIPLGNYHIEVHAAGFALTQQELTLQSGTHPVLHIALAPATVHSTVTVNEPLSQVDSVTPTTLLSRAEIDETPGALRPNSFAVVTDYVPGAYITHDMLHNAPAATRPVGLIDGVSIPNTNIGSNVGPQIDPKDMEALETQRGSYAADEGDRTYGIFNVVPRNGFERDREAELILTGGNFQTGSAQLSLGNHSTNAAWYASAAGSRSTYGLQPPIAEVLHDGTNSESGFGSVIVNHGSRDQFRIVGQMRQDYFQVPYDPNPESWENQNYDSSQLRDGQTERDGFLLATWARTLSPRASFELSPFYHLNTANYDSKASDFRLRRRGTAPATTAGCRAISTRSSSTII